PGRRRLTAEAQRAQRIGEEIRETLVKQSAHPEKSIILSSSSFLLLRVLCVSAVNAYHPENSPHGQNHPMFQKFSERGPGDNPFSKGFPPGDFLIKTFSQKRLRWVVTADMICPFEEKTWTILSRRPRKSWPHRSTRWL
ncbi:MAG: hypothetical protein AB1646_19905, partial [Thermodesulfobacteriota bacterium]